MKINRSKSPKKVMLLLLAAVLLAGCGVGAYALYLRQSQSEDTQDRPINSVDYSGPTKVEQSAANDQKRLNKAREDKIENTEEIETASLIITDAGQYENQIEVRAFVTNLIEDGKCSVKFAKSGSSPITTNSTAIKDAKGTQCGALDTETTRFPVGGIWTAEVSFLSNTGKKGMATTTLKVEK